MEPSDAGAGYIGEDPAATRWRPCFEAALHRILSEYAGEKAEVRDGMESGMRKLLENPYQAEMSRVLGAPTSVEDAQRIIFFPRLSDMRHYATVFALSTSQEETQRREKYMKFKMLSVFYTSHRKDGALMDRFMHCGGLESLAALLDADNNVIQSEAAELLIELLAPVMQLQAAGTSRMQHLHHQVYKCLTAGCYWQNLAKILAEPHELFPHSHVNCLKMVAGAIGWLRPEDAPTTLPPQAALPHREEMLDALQRLLDSSARVDPQMRELAGELIQELAAHPKVRGDPLQGPELAAAEEALFGSAAMAREDAAHSWQALRKMGNEAFGASLVWPAEACYRMALEEGGNVPAAEASLIESNRALALLRAGHHSEAASAAARALARDPRNAKAAYRRAQALLDGPAGAAASGLREAVRAAELAVALEPKDAKVAEVLAGARRRLESLGPEEAAQAETLDEMD